MAGYNTRFPQIGGCVCSLSVTASSNGMSYLVEKFGADCATYGANSVGGLPCPCSDVGSPAMTVAQNDMSPVEFSDTNFGSNYNVNGRSDDEVFDYLGRLDFNLFSKYSL